VWIVDGDELNARLLQAEKEVSVTREAVEPGNDQLGVEGAAGFEGAGERRAIVITLAALDFDMLLNQRPASTIQIIENRLALSLKPKAGFALALGRNPQLRNVFAAVPGHVSSLSRNI
jgi:hypothetical protein